MRTLIGTIISTLLAGPLLAAEVTVKNDNLTDFSAGVIQAGFVTGEKAASWLTSPCAGNIVAVQVFWRSFSGTTGQLLGGSIDIHRAGTFPTPGPLAVEVAGPLLTDGVLNEYRYLDDNSTIPLVVPVTQNETFVVSYEFSEDPPGSGPSVVNDADGIQTNRNAIYAQLAPNTFVWFNSATLGVTGDWVVRAVVDCTAASTEADVSASITTTPTLYTAGAALTYTITIGNAGPAAAPSVVVVDTFPPAFTSPTWSCSATGGATCTSGGSGNIAQPVSLPNGAQVIYTVNGTVAPGTTGVLVNGVTTVVSPPTTDPQSANNAATANTASADDRLFAHGFEVVP